MQFNFVLLCITFELTTLGVVVKKANLFLGDLTNVRELFRHEGTIQICL